MATLSEAIYSQNLDRVKEILESTPSPSQGALDKALSLALSDDISDDDSDHGFSAAVDPLLAHGAQVTKCAFLGAAARNDPAIFQTLVDHGWDINSVKFGQPALRLVTGSESCVAWFLKHGADPNLRGTVNASPLATAALQPSIPVLELLISYGAELDPNALFKAIDPRGNGGLPVLKYLIDRGVDVNAVQPPKGTPLHYAVEVGSVPKVELLIERGADRRIKNELGKTPADIANEAGRNDLAKLLLG